VRRISLLTEEMPGSQERLCSTESDLCKIVQTEGLSVIY